MPAVARANKKDSVLSPDGGGYKCRFPLTVTTGTATQSKVTADKIPLVVAGDLVVSHSLPDCVPIDKSKLSSFSSKVSACGSKIARIGDAYGNNTIISGSSKVFSN